MAFVGSLSGSGGASNTINVTGSMIIANPGTGGAFPSFPGTDTVFFVSGALGGKAAGSRTVSVFGGDVVASGSITVGTGSITITSNEIQFLGGIAKIYSGTSGLTFADSTGTKTLASLATGGGDVTGPASSTDNAIARFDLTTGKIIQNSDVTIGDASGGAVAIDSVTSTTVNLFNTNATTAVNVGGQAPAVSIGKTAGIVTTAGKLKVAGNEIQSSTGELALAFTGSNVVIPGDLTVQGTTVTVDATTLTIEDPIIGLGFTSGSTAVSPGDRGFIGGLSAAPLGNTALFWKNADSTFAAARTTDTAAAGSPVTVTSYAPFRASSFQLGGVTAFISSSDGTTLTSQGNAVSSTATGGTNSVVASTSVALNSQNGNTLFQNAGTDIMRVSGSAANSALDVKVGGAGVTTVNMFSSVATTVNFAGAASTSLSIGNAAGSNTFAGQTKFTQGLSGSLTKLSDGVTSYLVAGSNVTITTGTLGNITIAATAPAPIAAGADTQVQFNDGGTAFGADADFTFTKATNTLAVPNASVTAITASSVMAAGASVNLFNTTATTVNFAGAADLVNIGKLTGGAVVNISSVLTGANPAFFGDTVTIGGPTSATLQTTKTTANLFNTTATTVNFGGAATTMKIASGSGTAVEIGGSTGRTTVYNDMFLATGNIVGAPGTGANVMTLISSGNIIAKLDTDGSAAGHQFIVQDNLGVSQFWVGENGNAELSGSLVVSGSTTLGKTAGVGTVTFNNYVNSDIIPGTTNAYDLGTPSLRWRNMYTGDLHLKNERGDWTVIEEEEFLTLTNNKSGKRYKFVLEEI